MKLENHMDKCGSPFYGVDRLTGDLYAMRVNTMTLIPEKATIMPQVSSTIVTYPVDPSQKFSPSLGTVTGLIPKWVFQLRYHNLLCWSKIIRIMKEVLWGTSFSIASFFSSGNGHLTNKDITREMLDEEIGRQILGKK